MGDIKNSYRETAKKIRPDMDFPDTGIVHRSTDGAWVDGKHRNYVKVWVPDDLVPDFQDDPNPEFGCPNLDAMDVGSLLGIAEVFSDLSKYSFMKGRAMLHREKGQIAAALELEKRCAELFEALPDEWKW